MNSVPWRLIHSYLAVVKLGSLSSAALSLNISQPTISRDIQQLEKQLGVQLFKRTTKGLVATKAGKDLLSTAKQMEHYAYQFERVAFSQSNEIRGDLRISANELIAFYELPKLIEEFRSLYPYISIDLVVDNKESNLNNREADIAFRMFRPKQEDLIAKRLEDIQLGLFASVEYLEKHETPKDLNDLISHTLIGFDKHLEMLDSIISLGIDVKRDTFDIRTDSLLSHIALMRSGVGIGVTHKNIAKQYSELKEVATSLDIPPIQYWLVCHRDIHQNNRIRAFMDFIN